ncbi:hypothetical protein B0A52_03858 [Exophiala mesophila]|uniref:Ornithine aminotransferase n=1 Tax=Exophiala mesophila TaxID=212818 RepID=A0A438N7D9_EXOME|nr:hypothetical protein B0A52_03858 [Exophiala mesophila]
MGEYREEGAITKTLGTLALTEKTEALLQQERQYVRGGFEPGPAFFERAKGSKLWDVDGKEYIDFIAMFSSVNQGHGHPFIAKKVIEQMEKSVLVNLAAHNTVFPPFTEMMCKRFGYDKIVVACSGTEAAEAAYKLARVGESYHGLGSGVWGLMDLSSKRAEYGLDSRIVPNVNPSTGESLGYLNADAMRRYLEEHHGTIAAVIMEPLHGSSRTIEEEISYARAVYELCRKYNVLYIADEKEIVIGWNYPTADYVTYIGVDSNLFFKNLDGLRVAALYMHTGLFVHPRPKGLRISFVLTMTHQVLEQGAAIIKGVLDQVDHYEKIAGEKFNQ